jgi:hypothetical protein
MIPEEFIVIFRQSRSETNLNFILQIVRTHEPTQKEKRQSIEDCQALL